MARRRVVILLALLAVTAPMGCSSDPEECARDWEGNFKFAFDPELAPTSGDSLNIERDITNARLNEILPFPNSVPPIVLYRFSTPTQNRLDLRVDDLGNDLPLQVDSTYTLTVDLTTNLVPGAMGIKIFDDRGLLFMGVQDFRPSGDDLSRIFQDGYGELNGSGELSVFFGDSSCPPAVENTSCYRDITNQRLDFLLPGRSIGLWHGDEGVLDGWLFHVYKSAIVVAKACPAGLGEQNAISFFVQRQEAG